MQRSEQINELAGALAKAQAEIEGAAKTRENTHFRASYADLGAVWDAIREPLSKHGLSVVQFPRACEIGVEIETTLLHTSGQYMADTLAMPVQKRDAHGFGSAITYARRYALMAVAGIAPVDDDAAEAVKRDTATAAATTPQVKTATPAAVPPKPQRTARQWTDDAVIALKAMTAASAVADWQSANKAELDRLESKAPAEYTRLMDTINERLDALRPQAAE